MSFVKALLARDASREKVKLEKQATKSDLYGSVGSTLLQLAVSSVLGPGADPFIKGLATFGSSLFGGAIGSKVAGPIPKGDLFQSSRDKLKKELDPFGSKNITGALTSGVTAGVAQKAKIAGDVSKAETIASSAIDATPESIAAAGEKAGITKGFDFRGSLFGPRLEELGPMFEKLGQTLIPGGEPGYLPGSMKDFSSIYSDVGSIPYGR